MHNQGVIIGVVIVIVIIIIVVVILFYVINQNNNNKNHNHNHNRKDSKDVKRLQKIKIILDDQAYFTRIFAIETIYSSPVSEVTQQYLDANYKEMNKLIYLSNKHKVEKLNELWREKVEFVKQLALGTPITDIEAQMCKVNKKISKIMSKKCDEAREKLLSILKSLDIYINGQIVSIREEKYDISLIEFSNYKEASRALFNWIAWSNKNCK